MQLVRILPRGQNSMENRVPGPTSSWLCRNSRDINVCKPLGLDRPMGLSAGQKQPEQKIEQEVNEELEGNQETQGLELT